MLTDRAYRYRANHESVRPKGRKICSECGSARFVGVDHVDGFEENNSPKNLRWLCKSCNTRLGLKMKREGKGRRTRQFNPLPAILTAGLKEVARGLLSGTVKKRKRNFYPFTKDKPFVEIEFRKRGRGTSPTRSKSKRVVEKSEPSKVKKLDADVEDKLAAHYAKGGTLKEFLQSNPGSMSKKQAEELSKKWHGREAKIETEIEEIENYSENVAELGDLEELGVLAADLQSRFSIFFKKDRPKLCASDEHNLEFIGGDQSLKDTPEGVMRDRKQLVPLGYIIQIVYVADKHHLQDSNGSKESYEHFFGEEFYKENLDSDDYKSVYDWFEDCMSEGFVQEAVEDGLIPMLVYNKTDEKMMVVGGSYTVEDVGIKN
jgi:hypothetical protein